MDSVVESVLEAMLSVRRGVHSLDVLPRALVNAGAAAAVELWSRTPKGWCTRCSSGDPTALPSRKRTMLRLIGPGPVDLPGEALGRSDGERGELALVLGSALPGEELEELVWALSQVAPLCCDEPVAPLPKAAPEVHPSPGEAGRLDRSSLPRPPLQD